MAKLLIILAVLFLGSGVYVYVQKAGIPATSTPQGTLVGSDKDSHGCIGSAGYTWCANKEKCLRTFEEFCPDDVKKLVRSIGEASGVTLTQTGTSTFNWIAGNTTTTADILINGVRFSAENVKMADYNKIEKYLNKNFEQDNNNIADGVQGGLRGYYVNYMVCDLNFRHFALTSIPNQPSVPIGDSLKVTLECGFYNRNDVPGLLLGQTIKEKLAVKYKKSIDEIGIRVAQFDDTYANGNVFFGKGTEGGMFLAKKIQGSWQVIYDGNGTVPCNDLRTVYNFPNSFLKGFCEVPSITLLSPNGREVWKTGSTHMIKWKSFGLSENKIAVHIRRISPPPLQTEGQEFDPVVFINLENNGSKSWTISNTYPPGDYVLELVSYPSIPVTTTVTDESDLPFKLTTSTKN